MNGSGNLTAYFDRASINPTERGPIQPETPENPESEPESEPESPGPEHVPSRVGLWRLGETGGTVAADAVGTAPGVYLNEPTLGVPGIAGDNGDTAVSFDGVDDHVAIAPTAPLDMRDGVTLEAWVLASTFRGSMIQRTNSYELRPQGNGNIVFRVWVNGIDAVARRRSRHGIHRRSPSSGRHIRRHEHDDLSRWAAGRVATADG